MIFMIAVLKLCVGKKSSKGLAKCKGVPAKFVKSRVLDD